MDPLSAVVNIVTLLGAGGAIMQAMGKVLALRQAPDVVLALNNEISDLRLVTMEIHKFLQDRQRSALPDHGSEITINNMTPTLNRANEKLLELERLIEYELTKAPGSDGELRINKTAWMRNQGKAKVLMDEIRSIRTNLVTSLGVLGSKTIGRVELRLSEIQYSIGSVQHQQAQQAAVTSQLLSNQLATNALLPNVLAAHEAMNRKVDLLLSAYASGQRATMHSFSKAPISEGHGHWEIQLSSVHRTYLGACFQDCRCNCHHRSTWKSPSYFRSIFGMLFLGYVGVPSITPNCNDFRCKQKADMNMKVSYYFPHWFVARAININIRLSKPDGLTQTLRVARMIPDTSKILSMAEAGDIEGMKQIFRSRKASPFDQDISRGRTPLYVSPIHLTARFYFVISYVLTVRFSQSAIPCVSISTRPRF